MGRSVSYPNNALLLAFSDWYQPEYDQDAGIDMSPDPEQEDWDWYVEDIQESAKSVWPSFTDCDEWVGREDRAILENDLGYIGVSEYCGVAAIWFVAKEDHWSDEWSREALAQGFASRIAPTFYRYFGDLDRLGGLSDGTSVYTRRNAA